MKIGDEEISFSAETKRALDIEIILLHIPLLISVFFYAYDYLTWPVFYLLFHLFEMRIFIGNHDRFHTDTSVRLPRALEAFSEYIAVCVVPWEEPYDSVKRKHIKHHATHGPGKSAPYNTRNDPHAVFEMPGFIKPLLSSMFYEEIQLILDIRNRNLSAARLIKFSIYLPLQIAFLYFFGWQKYLGVFAAMRIVGSTGWFVFSWGIHQPIVYRFGFNEKVPVLFNWAFRAMNGYRVSEGVFHHAAHHAWPGIPTRRLHEFDTAIVRNPNSAPDIRPIGH